MFVRNQALTWTFALLDMVIEADLVLPGGDRFVGQVVIARSDHENVPYCLQRKSHGLYVRVRPKIARTGHFAAGDKNAGIQLLGNDNVRVGLVVLEDDVVPRLELLDKIGFEDEGFHFRRSHGQFDVVNLPNHCVDPRFNGP